LKAYDWPGNVRQLENAVYRAIVLADSPYLQPHDFPAISGLSAPLGPMGEAHAEGVRPAAGAGSPQTGSEPLGALQAAADSFAASSPQTQGEGPVRILDHRGHLRTLEEIERDLIQLAIEIYAGHMTEVARRLGIGRSTLYRKVREQGLEDLVRDAG
jgi:DNA-binding NtrC family response regulator